MRRLVRPAALAVASVLFLSACAADTEQSAGSAPPAASVAQHVRVVQPSEAAALLADAPADLVVLDVRTPQEFADSRLPGAVNLDVSSPDFREELASLDRDVPYILYCRSGNRSAQARAMMADLGFSSVTDVAGGIVAWQSTGLPIEG